VGELCGRLDSVGMKFTLTFEPCNAPAFLTTPESFTKFVTDAVEKKTGRRPVNLGRDIGRALYPRLLPGGRIRPRWRDRTYGGRACRGRRHRGFDGNLCSDFGRLF
jgi:hypothetical protein